LSPAVHPSVAQKDENLTALHGTRFEDDESVIRAVRTWLHDIGNELVQGRHECRCFALA